MYLSSRPGSMQARGDNLFSLMKAFTNSSKLLNAQERAIFRASANESDNQQAIFFDYYSRFLVAPIFYFCLQLVNISVIKYEPFSKGSTRHILNILLWTSKYFQVFYSRKQAILFHSIPVAIFLLMPLLLRLPSCGLICLFNTYCDFLKGNGVLLTFESTYLHHL